MTKNIVIVDGYSTGRYLAPTIHDRGGSTIHVPSSPEPPTILQKDRDSHGASIALDHASPAELADKLQNTDIDAVIAGAESGVLYADELAEHLGLEWNTPATSTARRDKFDMIERLRVGGLPVVDQIRSADPDAIHQWAQAQRSWPIVIKPAMSTSSEDVFFCHSVDQIRCATETIVGKRNFLDVLNTDVLAQTYLDGPIYVVNSVSRHGRHITSDVWKFDFERTLGKGIRMLQHSLLQMDFPHIGQLIDYNNRALTELGINHGPSHTELKLTESGPSMLETGARLMGATIEERFFHQALHHTQVDLTAIALCEPDHWAELPDIQRPSCGLAIVWIHFDQPGRVISVDGLRNLDAISSVVATIGIPTIGDLVGPSHDTTGTSGFVYLQTDDEQQLQRDCRRVRRLVRDNLLFDIDPLEIP